MYRIYEATAVSRTSWRVGGRIDRLTVAERPEEARPGVPVLGRGTNVLISDGGLTEAIMPAIRGIALTPDGVYAGAGEPIAQVARFAAAHGLTGLEWAAGIPGSVGGAVYGNAGAFGTAVSDKLVYCERNDGTVNKLDAADCGFSVRASRIDGVVTGACFDCRPGAPEAIEAAMARYAKYRRETQPRGATAGSTFKAADKPAGWYLERAGLKGERIGGASVSELHANFILTEDGATATDVYRLIRRMQTRVYETFGVMLEEEIVYLGEFSCF